MSIKDVIKNSFLEGIGNSAPSFKMIVVCLIAAILLGAYICAIYRITVLDSFYSRDFNLSLVMVTVITTAIIITIQSSVVVSLGMVGALSIVRFRTAVKNPMDLVFMFWAICMGIVSGTGLIGLAVFVSVIMTVIIFVSRIIPGSNSKRYLLSLKCNDNCDTKKIKEVLAKADKFYKIQSETIVTGSLSMTIELVADDTEAMMKELHEIDGVISISLIAHRNGDGV